jgi:hypothetical protein|tara:strand:+ start:288 stop:524 length:237 start_codon:yes stop_codon:yes gene_type:complete
MIAKQTIEQFNMLYGDKNRSRTANACFDVIFNAVYRKVASKEHGVTVQTICIFIRNNEHKHSSRYLYVDGGLETTNNQ